MAEGVSRSGQFEGPGSSLGVGFAEREEGDLLRRNLGESQKPEKAKSWGKNQGENKEEKERSFPSAPTANRPGKKQINNSVGYVASSGFINIKVALGRKGETR